MVAWQIKDVLGVVYEALTRRTDIPNRSLIVRLLDLRCDGRFAASSERNMLDLVFLALGLGLFGLMGLYARWAARN
jgi:hypothetical protein